MRPESRPGCVCVGGGGQCPRGHLPWHLSGRPRLEAQLLCRLSGTPARLWDSVFSSVKWAWPCALAPRPTRGALLPFCRQGSRAL